MFDVSHVLERLKQVLSQSTAQHCMHHGVLLVLKAVWCPLLLVHAGPQAAGAYLCFAGPAAELRCESGQLLLQQLGLPLKQPLGVVDLWVRQQQG